MSHESFRVTVPSRLDTDPLLATVGAANRIHLGHRSEGTLTHQRPRLGHDPVRGGGACIVLNTCARVEVSFSASVVRALHGLVRGPGDGVGVGPGGFRARGRSRTEYAQRQVARERVFLARLAGDSVGGHICCDFDGGVTVDLATVPPPVERERFQLLICFCGTTATIASPLRCCS
jgi:hypothetical protein